MKDSINEIKAMQQDVNALNQKRDQVIKTNSVVSDFPTIDRSFTYRTTTVIRANDIGSL